MASLGILNEPRRLKTAFVDVNLNERHNMCNLQWSDRNLSYIGHECLNIPDIISKSYGDLAKRLDLSYNSIRCLKGLEKFTILEELILDNNNIDDSAVLPFNPHLSTLSLNKNNLKDLEILVEKLSTSYPNLTYLSLLGNAACPNQLSCVDNDDDDYQRYRFLVIYKMPKLKFLDSSEIRKKEKLEAFKVGSYMKVARPTTQQVTESAQTQDTCDGSDYSPLPLAAVKTGLHKGAFGQRKHLYSGKNSEGNRFIHDNDL